MHSFWLLVISTIANSSAIATAVAVWMIYILHKTHLDVLGFKVPLLEIGVPALVLYIVSNIFDAMTIQTKPALNWFGSAVSRMTFIAILVAAVLVAGQYFAGGVEINKIMAFANGFWLLLAIFAFAFFDATFLQWWKNRSLRRAGTLPDRTHTDDGVYDETDEVRLTRGSFVMHNHQGSNVITIDARGQHLRIRSGERPGDAPIVETIPPVNTPAPI